MKTPEIRPCHIAANLDIEECRREQAEFWGVYERYDHGDGQFLADWVADFMTEPEALAFVAERETP